MTIQAVTMYRAVCDCCGRHDGSCDTYQDSAVDLLDELWTVDDSGAVRCNWCHEHDRHDACEADGGHDWDTAANEQLGGLWIKDARGDFRLRQCASCRHMQQQRRGGDWYGFRHGEWLGDLQEAT